MDHTTLLLPKLWDTNWPLRTVVYSYGHLSYEYVANMFAYPHWKRKQALPKVERVNIGHFFFKKKSWCAFTFRPRRGVVSLTSRSRTSHFVPPRSETSAAHEYASFSQSRYKKVGYACIYFVLWATDQVKQLGNWPNTYAKRLQKLANRTLAKRPLTL